MSNEQERMMDKSYDLKDEWELDPELLRDVGRWVEAGNKREHASLGAVPKDDPELGEESGHNKQAKERVWAKDFAKSLLAKLGREITKIESNPDDPPDCFAEESGKMIGIEVTELVKGEILNRIAQNRYGKKDYSPSELFTDEQWTHEDFIQRVQESIDKKVDRAIRTSKIFDVLLIYTDEDDLYPERLKKWLSNDIYSAKNIKEVFLLRSGWPGYRDHSLLFQVNIE